MSLSRFCVCRAREVENGGEEGVFELEKEGRCWMGDGGVGRGLGSWLTGLGLSHDRFYDFSLTLVIVRG